jgi:hypothetical protein
LVGDMIIVRTIFIWLRFDCFKSILYNDIINMRATIDIAFLAVEFAIE